MALVSYGCSDESDLSENEEEQRGKMDDNNLNTNVSLKNLPSSLHTNSFPCDAISDEEDNTPGKPPDDGTSIFDEKDVPVKESSNSLFSSLPALPRFGQESVSNSNGKDSMNQQHVDENEDMNTIPERKIYEGETLEIKPRRKDITEQISNTAQKNPHKKAPVRIMAPSLLSEREVNETEPPKKKFAATSKTSGLLGLLPKPKNSLLTTATSNTMKMDHGQTSKSSSAPKVNQTFVPRSVSRKPTGSTSQVPPRDPNKLSKRNVSKVNAEQSNDTDDESDSEPSSFFTLEEEPLPDIPTSTNFGDTINSSKNNLHDQTLAFDSASTYNETKYTSYELNASSDYTAEYAKTNYTGEAIAPYPPVGPSSLTENLMDNTEALERLAGRIRKGRGGQNKVAGKESIADNIIDVNQGDLTADPREWLTKTLTQDDDAPGPRCNIGGTTKRKHQITYLAAMAKQNENELKKQWAENSQSRRAHQSKYGF